MCEAPLSLQSQTLHEATKEQYLHMYVHIYAHIHTYICYRTSCIHSTHKHKCLCFVSLKSVFVLVFVIL